MATISDQFRFWVIFSDGSLSSFGSEDEVRRVLNTSPEPPASVKHIILGLELTPVTKPRTEIVGFKELSPDSYREPIYYPEIENIKREV